MDTKEQTQLIEKMQMLRDIKPNREWAVLLKHKILTQKPAENKIGNWEIGRFVENWKLVIENSFARKLAYSFGTLVFMVIGLIGFAQYTVPGDMLFPIKKLSEQTQTQSSLQMAYNRSQELVQIVKENKTQNLAPAMSEYKASISDAVKNLALAFSKDSTNDSKKIITEEVRKIQENQKELETLGVNVKENEQTDELNNVLAVIVQSQIDDLEKSTLTEEQEKSFEEAKKLFEEKKYTEALEKILFIN